MVNARLYWFLESSNILCHEQAGFRKGSCTEDQLFRLTQRIHDGFQSNKHTVAIFVDLQQAYDRVWRKGLLMKMIDMGIGGKLY
jgi:DnaJ-domain-containing protein 1